MFNGKGALAGIVKSECLSFLSRAHARLTIPSLLFDCLTTSSRNFLTTSASVLGVEPVSLLLLAGIASSSVDSEITGKELSKNVKPLLDRKIQDPNQDLL